MLSLVAMSILVFSAATYAQQIYFSPQVPNSVKAELEADFAQFDLIQGTETSALHQKFFGPGPLDGRKYKRYFSKHIRHIDFAYNHPFFLSTDGAGTMFVTNEYLQLRNKVSLFGRISTLIHEARHNDQEDISDKPEDHALDHELCPDPFLDEEGKEIIASVAKTPLAGKRACESKYNGSYEVQIVVLKNIQKFCLKCASEERKKAGDLADDLMKRITSPADKQILIKDLYETSAAQAIKIGGSSAPEPKVAH